MIDKTINYVWLSGDEKPALIKKCIRSWEKNLQDYRIRGWTASDFDMERMPVFVREAYEQKKWAFATDYLRLYIIEKYGGIYMDSDIFVRKSFDPFLGDPYFSFIEYHEKGFEPFRDLIDENGAPLTDGHIPGFCLQAALFGAEKHHPFLKRVMEYYENISFEGTDGMIAPDIHALTARDFGFRYLDREQRLGEGMRIYPSSLVAGCFRETDLSENIAIHCCMGSWRDGSALRTAAVRFLQRYYYPLRYMR